MDKIESVQRGADELKVILEEDIKKVYERGEKLDDVNKRSEELKEMGSHLQKTTKKLKNKKRMEYLRANKVLIAIMVVAAVIIIAVLAAMYASKGTDEHSHSEVHSASEEP